MRFGLIVPSSNSTMEWEFQRMLPPAISLHTSRVRLQDVTIQSLRSMAENIKRAALELADAEVDLIAYGCTSGSLFGGSSHEREIASKISQAAGVSALTTAGAVCDALRSLSATQLAVATPYLEEVNERERIFLEEEGFRVVSMEGLGIRSNRKIGHQDPETVYALGKRVFREGADALFISCTNLRTIEVIARLEKDLGGPVVSSNTATLWKMLKLSGSNLSLPQYGRLLSSL